MSIFCLLSQKTKHIKTKKLEYEIVKLGFSVAAHLNYDILVCDVVNYAANIEVAECIPTPLNPSIQPSSAAIETISTPDMKSVEVVSQALNYPLKSVMKSFLVQTTDGQHILLVLRGDHQLNELKDNIALYKDKIISVDDIEFDKNKKTLYSKIYSFYFWKKFKVFRFISKVRN